MHQQPRLPPMNPEPGWAGLFTRNQHPDAYPNGTRIAKAVDDDGDTHGVGALGTVLGSMRLRQDIGYFVEWDDIPRCAVFVMASRIARAH